MAKFMIAFALLAMVALAQAMPQFGLPTDAATQGLGAAHGLLGGVGGLVGGVAGGVAGQAGLDAGIGAQVGVAAQTHAAVEGRAAAEAHGHGAGLLGVHH